jgi:hypothetical protein
MYLFFIFFLNPFILDGLSNLAVYKLWLKVRKPILKGKEVDVLKEFNCYKRQEALAKRLGTKYFSFSAMLLHRYSHASFKTDNH